MMPLLFEPVDLSLAPAARSGARMFRHSGMFDGCPLTVTYLVDDKEHRSRSDKALGAVTDERTLAALLALPVDDLAPVPSRFLKALSGNGTASLAMLIREPHGSTWGQRKLGVPVEVLEIEARARDWTRGCALAHRWVGYAPRTVRVACPIPGDPTLLLTEAAHYGLGVIAGAQDTRLLKPSAYEPRRWTPSRWRFAELVYEQFLTSDAANG
ncbi:hypothetical protein ACFVTM_03850 [Arthrobacter sp. NPDC058130]|uniref:hypothetical protein n=1 Tax=Arthrobacter sp. NPDC058130 TaxID=3346353 RepID=UPI0036E9E198